MSLGEGFTFLAYAVGALVFLWAAAQRKMATNGIAWVVAIGFTAGIAGAKLTQILAQGWPLAIPPEAALDPRIGGRALLGGLVFGWVGVEVAKRRLGIRRSTGDLFALALPAGEAVGRLGCFLNECCFGTPSDVPWAVEQQGALRHPAQLYSAALAAIIFATLLWLRRRVALPEGALFRWYLVLFCGARFFLEFARHRDTLIAGLSPVQWLCIEIPVSVGIYLLVKSRRLKVATP